MPSSNELWTTPVRYVFRSCSSTLRRKSLQSTRRSDSTRPRCLSTASPSKRPRTALFFPGQGVQRVGMIDPWLSAFPRTVKPFLDELDETLNLPNGVRLSRVIAEGPNKTLNATENSQPAIMATSILIARILEQEFGFKIADRVDVTLGHSLGEFAALVAAGYMHFADALLMVRRRAEVMAHTTRLASEQEKGELGMVALVCENEERMRSLVDAIHEFLGLSGSGSKSNSEDIPAVQQVLIANINSKNQIVLSGSIERIYTLLAHLRQFGGHDPRHVRLKSDSPFHSPLMKPAEEVMYRILAKPSKVTGEDKVVWPGLMPSISNITGRPFKSREELKDLLARSCCETVQWWKSVQYLDKQEKIRRWIGLGPGKVGRNLVGKEVGMKGQVKGGGVWAITSPKEVEEVLKGLDETEVAQEEEEEDSI